MRRKKKSRKPFVPCGSCCSGLRVIERRGDRFAIRCRCWIDWKLGRSLGNPTKDSKTSAAGA